MKLTKWYYGWYIVLAASIISLFTAGFRMSFGPFFIPMLEDFNMTRTELSSIIAVGMLIFGIGMPLAGFLESRFGPKFVLILGAFVTLGSIIWTVFSTNALNLLLSFGILQSLGLALTGQVTFTPTLVRWFVRKRGQALLYLSTGSMAGIAIMNPVSNFLVMTFSWKHAMLFFGISLFIIIVSAALFVIRVDVPEGADGIKNEDQSATTTTSSQTEPTSPISLGLSFKTLPFWQICIGLFACGFSMNLLGSHGVPMLTDHGFTSTIASSAIGLIGLVAIPGTIILASLADRIPKRNLLALIYLTRGIGFICIVLVVATYQLYLVALIAGMAWAGNNALASAILTDVYGPRLVGILYGFAYLVHQIGATFSTLLGGWAYDTFQTHLISFGSAGIILLIAGFVSLRIPFKLNVSIPQKSKVLAN